MHYNKNNIHVYMYKQKGKIFCLYSFLPEFHFVKSRVIVWWKMGGRGKTFVKLFSETTNRSLLIFGMHHQGVVPYRVTKIRTCRTTTSCLRTQILFSPLLYIGEIFVKLFSETANRSLLIFGVHHQGGVPYRVTKFRTCWTTTSCLTKFGFFAYIYKISTFHLKTTCIMDRKSI